MGGASSVAGEEGETGPKEEKEGIEGEHPEPSPPTFGAFLESQWGRRHGQGWLVSVQGSEPRQEGQP